MKKTIILYGLLLAALVFLLKMLEYRLWVRELEVSHYIGIVAIVFTTLGVWAGLRLTRRKPLPGGSPEISPRDVDLILRDKGISRREFEVLELISKGYSNQEIADKLFISINTVKTHLANLFIKLNVKRRTQAIEQAKQEGLIL